MPSSCVPGVPPTQLARAESSFSRADPLQKCLGISALVTMYLCPQDRYQLSAHLANSGCFGFRDCFLSLKAQQQESSSWLTRTTACRSNAARLCFCSRYRCAHFRPPHVCQDGDFPGDAVQAVREALQRGPFLQRESLSLFCCFYWADRAAKSPFPSHPARRSVRAAL